MLEETNGKTHHHADSGSAWPTSVDRDVLIGLEARARKLDRRARLFIREHPATVVLAAVAIGFMVGRLVRS